ncbi:MAG: NINE protein [Cyanobacteria bacterium P01_G01_bin.49]
MRQVNSGVAYIVWCLCFFGVCGGQRFYTGNITSGLIYLFTFGVFGIGQFLDLILIPGMVDRRNIYLRGLTAGNPTGINPSITLNLGDMSQLKHLQTNQSSTLGTPMQRLLKAAKENGGTLSIAQAAMATELEAQEVKDLLQEAQRHGFADVGNDPNTGAVRYHFDV